MHINLRGIIQRQKLINTDVVTGKGTRSLGAIGGAGR
jgi:hypothetical protein